MEDYFAFLKQKHRPWLDIERLKGNFIEFSVANHPDKYPNATPEERQKLSENFSLYQTAYNTLTDTSSRLEHLIQILTGKPVSDIQRIPPGTMDVFMQVGQTCADVAKFIQKKESSQEQSPILKAKLFAETLDWTDKLTHLQQTIIQKQTALDEELKQISNNIDSGADFPIQRLEEIYRTTGYIKRWLQQIQEKLVQLAI